MNQPLNQFAQSTADWRQTIKQNNRKTFFVIAAFILIYITIGMLIDVFMAAGHFP